MVGFEMKIVVVDAAADTIHLDLAPRRASYPFLGTRKWPYSCVRFVRLMQDARATHVLADAKADDPITIAPARS